MFDVDTSRKTDESVSLGWFLRHRMLDVPQRLNGLAHLVERIARACSEVGEHVARCGARGTDGPLGRTNENGDQVCELNDIADALLVERIAQAGCCAGVVSEERASPVVLPTAEAPYLVALDPLDGSTNLGCSIPVGTIFSIQRRQQRDASDPASYLGLGSEQVAAGYVIYGSPPELVLTVGRGVHVFSLDGERRWRLRKEDVRLPASGRIYSANEANVSRWEPALRSWLASCKAQGYTQRYVGSMVADVHRTLFKGGIFLYPGDREAPAGKLRLLYEAAPMALLFESAGGFATDGARRLLELTPRSIHERTPVVLGSRAEVLGVRRVLASGGTRLWRSTASSVAYSRTHGVACGFELGGRRVRGRLQLARQGRPHQFLSEGPDSGLGR